MIKRSWWLKNVCTCFDCRYADIVPSSTKIWEWCLWLTLQCRKVKRLINFIIVSHFRYKIAAKTWLYQTGKKFKANQILFRNSIYEMSGMDWFQTSGNHHGWSRFESILSFLSDLTWYNLISFYRIWFIPILTNIISSYHIQSHLT